VLLKEVVEVGETCCCSDCAEDLETTETFELTEPYEDSQAA
jgi:hypothetical protein